jgi:hypothetical protein
LGHPIDAGGGFIRSDDAGGQQLATDGGTGLIQIALHPAKGIGDGALRDGDAKQFPQHPRQTLKADMVAVVEIQQQRPNARPERRPRRHPLRGRGPVTSPAAAAATAEQFDPRHYRADRRQLDVIIAMAAPLTGYRRRRPAMRAAIGHPALGLVGIVRQRAGHPRPRGPRLLGLIFVQLPVRPLRTILRWRGVRVGRGLLRLGYGRLKIGDPCSHALNQCSLLQQQGILLGVTQAVAGRQLHA